MYNPVSTIRLQFNKDFTFARLEELIPFVVDLGVRTIYASPIFKATPGSLHGYDIVDPLTINPEIGTEEDLVRIAQKLEAQGIGWIQDIVPNHMAFHDDNVWLKDVLEKKGSSEYAEYFDSQLSSDFFTSPITENSDLIYRRFFLIAGLICLNMHSRKVFDDYHQLIFRLVRNGTFKGLRVDHIDGLYDPEEYLRRLRDVVGPEVYIVIEKILEPGEELEKWWPIQGTTGYEFVAALNDLLTSRGARPVFDKIYQSIAPSDKNFDDIIIENKRLILFKYMTGELSNLTRYFIDLGLGTSDEGLQGAIAEVMIRCPNYRFYNYKRYRTALSELIDDCRTKAPEYNPGYDQLESALVEKPSPNGVKFYMRLMQFTGPLMAKGVEDTLMYRFNKFIGLNEVGDLPDEFGSSVSAFHETMTARLRYWQYSMNTTATHDTKRGEDSRARLHVLTDMPFNWAEQVQKWREMNRAQGIDPNDEYLIYQALIATYEDGGQEYIDRFLAYAAKALREAKVHSRWEDPNEKYEGTINDFIRKVVSETDHFLPFLNKVREHGIKNSLVQVLLKITCPGIPDIYQGSITWDFSFVDPDNRRPVDYDRLATSDNVKTQLIKKLLRVRSENEKVFSLGRYQPLKVSGNLRSNIIAFGREYQGSWMIVAALLHTAQLEDVEWDGTVILLPGECPIEAQDLIHENKFQHAGELKATDLFKDSPVALVFLEEPQRARRGGILMPVASLPSHFPIGDVGYSARQFADFLFESRQRIWQMLPVNAVDESRFFSPYSPISSIAGNTMLISMEDLIYDGLLTEEDVYSGKPWKKNVIDYDAAEKKKGQLLRKAFGTFNARKPPHLENEFQLFINEEKAWLDGFVEFTGNDAEFTRWTQFMFFRQMKALRKYCNDRDILLMGDVPFYVGSNSADASQYKNVFSTEMAGVPPDYFNDEGQFWGMPVFNWKTGKELVYTWWIQRLRKNLELYDFVRLDHFRAFSAYWSIPPGSKNGVNGEWVKGPGIEFFEMLKDELGDLRLVAEDLGDVDADVYELRDELGLPGMKVIQFGFGGDFPSSPHLPHNHNERSIAYPGTHDNNTTRGWFEGDVGPMEIKNLERYFNTSVSKRNIAELLTRVAFASHSQTAIVSMQDILGLDHRSRTNTPSTESDDNWRWRLKDVPTGKVVGRLRDLVHTYGR
ncbi:MAG TPA: malto-oligosyltrehalose synthase [Cyclobacteriaceae bacterium]|nr:malto-oligosyltrehalose synthase [Cyclobacteriaceae bacterium]